MKLAVEVFGKGMELEVGWGYFSLTVGQLLDVLYNALEKSASVPHGRRWFDWLSHDNGHLKVWLGRRHIGLDWGPAWERWRRAQAVNEGAAA
jgi:hypothetical protein